MGCIAGIAILATVTWASISPSVFAGQLRAWRVLPEQKGFTQLYFANGQHIPQGGNVTFVIHNNERSRLAYTYQISVLNEKGKHEVAKNTLALSYGQSQRVTHEDIAATFTGHGRIIVTVRYVDPDTNRETTQSIYHTIDIPEPQANNEVGAEDV